VISFYRAYGFTIASAHTIPALEATACDPATPDLTLEIGSPPARTLEALGNRAISRPPYLRYRGDHHPTLTLKEYGSGKFFELAYADGTRFLMDVDATHVWGQPGPGLSHDDVFVYFLGPIMGFLLRLRGRLALHASAVEIGGCAFAISGETGAGKSTTAAALARRGHAVVCEDICTVQDSSATKFVIPGYPRISLWPDSVTQLFSSPEALPEIAPGWEKRYLALDGRLASFRHNPAPLAAIYMLAGRSRDEAAPSIQPLPKRESALALVQNTYMNYLLTKEQRAAEFYAIGNLVGEVECYRVIPHADPARLADLASVLETHAGNLLRELNEAARIDVQP